MLKLLGVGLSATGVVSTTARRGAGATPERIEQLRNQYGTVVDVVEAGADNTGSESVTGVLDAHRGDDTLFIFPPGEYRMDEEFRHTGFTHFGIVGRDATIVPANYHDWMNGYERRLFRLGVYHNPGTDLLVEGLTVDQTAPDTGIRAVEAQVADGLVVRDVDVVGEHDSGTWGPGLFDVMNPSGTGVVERFTAREGGAWVSNTPNDGNLWRGPTGIMVSHYHRGTVELVDCELGGFPDNGVYAGNAKGTVVVDGGVYRNSHASNLRIGGHHSRIEGATVIVDENPGLFTNQRGIRLDRGSWLQVLDTTIRLERPNGNALTVLDDVESALVRGVDIVQQTAETNQCLVVEELAGPTYIQDTTVEMHGSGNAIEIRGADDPGEVGVVNVTVTGPAPGTHFRNAIRCERNDCEFRNLTIDQPGDDYRRALEINADDCLVYNSRLQSSHHPIIVNGTGAWIESVAAESEDGFAAIRLNDSSADVKVKNNTLVGGVLDLGSDGVSIYGNTYPDSL
ncbi:MAG: hypothetical protein ACQETI_06535 [Halobacteriota archaeon]